MERRTFVKVTGAAAFSLLAGRVSAADEQIEDDGRILVPAEKGFSRAWWQSLTARGEPEILTGSELRYIGMPVGGLCAGLVYLGGDGKPWLWDIFNRDTTQSKVTYGGKTFGPSDGAHYVEPMRPRSPFSHGFALRYRAAAATGERTLDQDGGWADIHFLGPYPRATVNYRDPAVPLAVTLDAFSPFIPLNFADSSLPATVLRYTVANTGSEPAEVHLGGWLENVVLAVSSPAESVARHNELLHDAGGSGVLLAAREISRPAAGQPDIVYADFADGTYHGWTVEGEAFGRAPVARRALPANVVEHAEQGTFCVARSAAVQRHGPDQPAAAAPGQLTSDEFVVERRYISFLSAGSNRPHEAGVRLRVDGQVVFDQTGENRPRLVRHSWDAAKYLGRKARLEIYDQTKAGGAEVSAAHFVFCDRDPLQPVVEKRHDFGTMAIYLVGAEAGGTPVAALPGGNPARTIFEAAAAEGSSPKPVAAVTTSFMLAPGESKTRDFVLTWHFANVNPRINGPDVVHAYAARFADAAAVARYVAEHLPRLVEDTFAWSEIWNDSTLPHWFLNRTFVNTCNLATTTSYRFANGQFWAWEGIYSCEGTCTHVWGYAQAMARIFPELERALREETDYAFALHPADGTIDYRGTHGGFAADGQAGIILRTYREHQMSVDDAFLKGLWPKVRLAMDRLVRQVNARGLLDGAQHNTLDTAWYGEVAWLSGLYLAALRAAEEMARIVGDGEYAGNCRGLFDKGSAALVPELFNGEYFVNKMDPSHRDAINSGNGCEIDQVMGQSWAWQVGLGRIFPQKETLTALRSLYRYNFAPDAGHYHELMKVGRWYVLPGEAGLLVCTFPKPGWDFKRASGKGPEWAALYFNECQSGYEHEAASHMIAEGLVQEGLAVTRAIHDRYAPAKRNPYNEIECGDHYSRAMASYASFISMCGFEYRGPEGYLAFAPRLTPEKFRAAFTSAQGWGSFEQTGSASDFRASIALKWGQLALRTVALTPPGPLQPKNVRVTLAGVAIPAALQSADARWHVALNPSVTLARGDTLEIVLS